MVHYWLEQQEELILSNTILTYLSGVSSNIQTQFSNTAKNNTANTFSTGQQTITNDLRLDGNLLVGTAGGTSISNTILTYLSGASSNIQTQIDGTAKLASANTLSGTNTITGNLIANTQTITPTELGYLSGVTSSIQNQINSISTSNFVSLTLDQTIGGLKTFSSLLTAAAGLVAYSLTSASNLALTTANGFITYINTGKTSGDVRINTGSPNSNTFVDNGYFLIGSPSTGTNFYISQPNSTQAGIYSGSLNNYTATDYCEGMFLLNNGYGAEIQGGRIGTTTDVCNLGFHNNGTTLNFLSAQNTTGSAQNNPVSITGQVNISGSLSLNGNYGILSYNPIGTIIHNCSASIGLPLLLCNGQTISRTTYASLFAVIGTTYGSGDGSTTFQIPNYSGAFLRGMGSQTPASITYASDVNPAQYQADQMRSHTHNGQSGSYLNTSSTASTVNGIAPVCTKKSSSSSFGSTGGVNSGGNGAETRPFNFGIYMYIRAI
jgi:microcystin-dependent protein